MSKLVILLALIALSLTLEGVVELTDANFKQQVYSEPKFWLVMFSASWVLSFSFSADTALNSSLKLKKQLPCWQNMEQELDMWAKKINNQ